MATKTTTASYQERVYELENRIGRLDVALDSKIKELQRLKEQMSAARMMKAAIIDARAGIYDKWYRNRYGDDIVYACAWQRETRQMIKEGYDGDWNVING